MSKAAFKDKRQVNQPLQPRPRYYNEPHLPQQPLNQSSPNRPGLVDHSGNWSNEPVKPSKIRLDQRREAVTQALHLSRAARDWEVFFKQVMGVDGLIYKLFPTAELRRQFETTAEYVEIQHILAEMRSRPQKRNLPDREKTKMITVRLPESLHAALIQEADELNTSMNKLCISKLLQIIDKELVK
ncbi:MAG: toxin-antitoxin system HicB family antitoxin [Pirellulales bacterium]|nr:toxin-antitoxin system HicB family antitoxin [Pirellulales bacterium]